MKGIRLLRCPGCGASSFLWLDASGDAEILLRLDEQLLTVIEGGRHGQPDYRLAANVQLGCSSCEAEWPRLLDLLAEIGLGLSEEVVAQPFEEGLQQLLPRVAR